MAVASYLQLPPAVTPVVPVCCCCCRCCCVATAAVPLQAAHSGSAGHPGLRPQLLFPDARLPTAAQGSSGRQASSSTASRCKAGCQGGITQMAMLLLSLPMADGWRPPKEAVKGVTALAVRLSPWQLQPSQSLCCPFTHVGVGAAKHAWWQLPFWQQYQCSSGWAGSRLLVMCCKIMGLRLHVGGP